MLRGALGGVILLLYHPQPAFHVRNRTKALHRAEHLDRTYFLYGSPVPGGHSTKPGRTVVARLDTLQRVVEGPTSRSVVWLACYRCAEW